MPVTAPSPVRVIPRASHMFAQRNAKPLPVTHRSPSAPTRERGMNYGGSGFASSSGGALYGDFRGAWGEINLDLRFALPGMWARSLQLSRDNEYARAYRRALVNNVLGSEGMHFQMDVRDPVRVVNGEKTGGDPDVFANKIIEEAREVFERRENYTVSRRLSRRDAQQLYLLCLSDYGDLFVRKVRGKIPGSSNPFQYSLQLVSPPLVDLNLNTVLPDGGKIIMGIEYDPWDAARAYHLIKPRPGVGVNYINYAFNQPSYGEHEVVPAADMIHVFREEYPGQRRGVPWLQAAMQKMHMLGAYEEAAIINARVGATKMGFFKKTTPDGFAAEVAGKTSEEIAEMYPDLRVNEGSLLDTPMPGEWQELPMNVEPVNWNPNYPEAQFDPFIKACLRGIAAGIGTSYITISNDLNGTSYSSARIGLTEEREYWSTLQTFWSENFCQPEFDDWIYMALAAGQLAPLPPSKLAKFNSPIFTGRGWDYINPLQDSQSDAIRLQMRQTSHSAIARSQGKQFSKLIQEMKDDDDALKAAGLTALEGTPIGTPSVGKTPVVDGEGDGAGA